MTSRTGALGATLFATLVMAGAPARGQGATPEQIASARSLGTEGVEAADAGDCLRAIDRLTRAEALYHAPTTLERLGECQIAVGKIVAGVESLNRVIRETFSGTPPPAFVAAQSRAKKALEPALARVAQVYIHVDKPVDVTATVKVDGEVVRPELLDVDRPIDPGTHKVEATAPGYRVAESLVNITPGKKVEVALKLEVDPNAAIAPPAPAGATSQAPAATASSAPPAAPGPPDAPPPAGNKLPAYVAFGVGGVGVAVGTLFGIMALGAKSTLDSACGPDKGCPRSSQSDIDSLGSKATISTVGFVVGALGLAAGGVLLFTAGKSSQPHVTAWIGPASTGVGGTFQ